MRQGDQDDKVRILSVLPSGETIGTSKHWKVHFSRIGGKKKKKSCLTGKVVKYQNRLH